MSEALFWRMEAERVLYECPSCGTRITVTFDQDPFGVEAAIEAHRRTHEPGGTPGSPAETEA